MSLGPLTLKEQIKIKINVATKARNPSKNILKVIIGEVDTQEARNGKLLSDEEVCKIIRKTVQGIEEMLVYKPGDYALETEKEILSELLPAQLSREELVSLLSVKLTELKSAKSDGQATGIGMKYLKEQGKLADGKDVTEVVKGLRN